MDDCAFFALLQYDVYDIVTLYLIGWHAPSRDNATGAPVADETKFPNGIKDLSDKIHTLGLKVCEEKLDVMAC